MNENLFLLINSFAGHSHILDLIMIILAKGGVYLFILTEVYLYFVKGRKNESIFAFYAVVAGLFMAFLTGLFYFHNRPFMDGIGKMIMYHAPENSFPSEHTVFMSSIAFMFLYLKNMRVLGAALLAIAIISGFARVFVGVHYPFDIAGGIIIGAISAYIIYLLKVYLQALNEFIFKVDNFLLGRFKNENKKTNYIIVILFIIMTLSPFSFSKDINSINLKKIESLKADNNTFSFVAMGDNRDGDNVLKKIIQSINSDRAIKFAINNGDLVPDGYKNEFKKYIAIIKTLEKPTLSIIGNHEIPWHDGEKNYKSFFGKTYFSFIFANSYFIILDDSDEKGVGKKQKQWLKNELEKSQKYQNRFVFMHVPLFDPRKGEYKKGHSLKNIKIAQMLNDLFDKYNITMLFCSHIHFYYRGFWHKTPFIITGGAGAPLKHYKNNGFYHYIKVIVNGKNVQYKVVRIKAKPLGFFKKTMKYIKDALGLD